MLTNLAGSESEWDILLKAAMNEYDGIDYNFI